MYLIVKVQAQITYSNPPWTGRVQFNEQKHVNDKVLEEITGLTDFSSTGRDRFNDQKHVSDKVLEEMT